MKKVIEKTRKGVIPTKKQVQEKSKVAGIAFDLVNRHISKYPQIVQIEFGGSYAKGTWLPEKTDIDIFLKFKSFSLFLGLPSPFGRFEHRKLQLT